MQPARAWSLAVFALLPITRDRIEQSEGSARVSTWLFAGAAYLHWRLAAVELALAAGVGSAIVITSGSAHAPYSARDDQAYAPAPFLGPSLHLLLGGRLRAYLRAIAGVTVPRMSLRFAAQDAARWGTPFLAAGLGVELALFGDGFVREP